MRMSKRTLPGILSCLCFLVAVPTAAAFDTFIVNSTSDSEVGSSPSEMTLRMAINAANNNGIGNDTIDFSFAMDSTILLGVTEVDSTSGVVRGKPLNILTDLTIQNTSGFEVSIGPTDNVYTRRAFVIHKHDVNGKSGPPTVQMSKLKLIGFRTGLDYENPAKPHLQHGAAISNWAKLKLIQVEFWSNRSTTSAGAIYNASELLVVDCRFDYNHADGRAGGIYSVDSHLVDGNASLYVHDSKFESNSGTRGGGAIYNSDERFSELEDRTTTALFAVSGSEFVGNYADDGEGGAIFSLNTGIQEVDRCMFSGNSAVQEDEYVDGKWKFHRARGGAIYTRAARYATTRGAGKTRITNSTFAGNQAERGGAFYSYLDDELEIENSTFSGNLATWQSGAIHMLGVESSGHILNCTITENVVEGNATSSRTGGILNQFANQFGVVVTVTNSIVSKNETTTSGGWHNYIGQFADGGGNLIGAAPTNTNPTLTNSTGPTPNDNPGLLPLSYNGGLSFMHTHLPDTNSDAIDAGVAVGGLPATDQRGLPRIQNGVVDIGSVEIQED